MDRRFYGNEGVFLWSHGSLSLVAKTGTVIPGVGTIASFDQYGRGLPNGYVHINDPGHVAFAAVLTDGTVALLLATPTEEDTGEAKVSGRAPAGHTETLNALVVSVLQGAAAPSVTEIAAAPHIAHQPTDSSPAAVGSSGATLPTLPGGVEMPQSDAVDQLFASLTGSVPADPLA